MKPNRTMLRKAAMVTGASLLIVAIGLEIRYGIFRSAPPVDRLTLVRDPSVVGVLNPDLAIDVIQATIRDETGISVPRVILRGFIPHEAGILMKSDDDTDRIRLKVYVSPRKLGPEMLRRVSGIDLAGRVPEIAWGDEGTDMEESPAIVFDGSVPMEPEAQEAAFYFWKQTFKPMALELEGGHLFEMVLDNRDGGAYLAIASLFDAYDLNLDEQDTDISLSSLQFILKGRMTGDFEENDTLRIHFRLDVKPDAIDRLGVINLKVGLDELFGRLAHDLQADHEVSLVGSSEWDGAAMVFDYRLSDARRSMQLLFQGKLLKAPTSTSGPGVRVRG